MDINTQLCIERAIEASNKKYNYLKDLNLLVMAQSEAINEDGMDGIKKLIGQKQVKIDEINKIDDDFKVYFDLLKQRLGVRSLDEINASDLKGAKELKQIIGQIMEILDEIKTFEKQNNEKAKKLLDDLGSKIRQIREGKKLNNVYNPTSGIKPPAYFLDKKK